MQWGRQEAWTWRYSPWLAPQTSTEKLLRAGHREPRARRGLPPPGPLPVGGQGTHSRSRVEDGAPGGARPRPRPRSAQRDGRGRGRGQTAAGRQADYHPAAPHGGHAGGAGSRSGSLRAGSSPEAAESRAPTSQHPPGGSPSAPLVPPTNGRATDAD